MATDETAPFCAACVATVRVSVDSALAAATSDHLVDAGGGQWLPIAAPSHSCGWCGTEPDLLDEVAWWQTDDFWRHALFAAVAYIRAAAGRAAVPVRQVCQDLAQSPGHPAL